MNYSELSKLLSGCCAPVLLLEGTRELPAHQVPHLTSLAAQLASAFRHARFRTGNAKGSDEAFAAGVAAVDAGRLEYVLPHLGHRRCKLPAESLDNDSRPARGTNKGVGRRYSYGLSTI